MTEFYTVITTAGLEAVAKAVQAGTQIDITHMAVGDGGGSAVTPEESQTQLVNECWRGLVATYKQEGNSLIIDSYIPPDEASFVVREMGLYTADGVLFAVCNTPEMRKVLPSEGAVGSFAFGMEIDIANIDMNYVEIHTNPMFDFIPNSEKGQPNGVAELGENGKIPEDQLPDLNFDSAGSAEAVQQKLNTHIANKQNPHGTTAAQVGAIPTAQRGAANGVATLDSNKQLTSTQIPASITNHIANKQNPHGVTSAQVGAYTKAETNNLINAGKVPTGSVFWFAANNAPGGFLICDGSKINRTTYSALFNIIGTAFGAGDGSTTFSLPNLINNYIKGSKNIGSKYTGTKLKGDNSGIREVIDSLSSSSSSPSYTGQVVISGGISGTIFTTYSIEPPSLTLLPCIKY